MVQRSRKQLELEEQAAADYLEDTLSDAIMEADPILGKRMVMRVLNETLKRYKEDEL